MKTIDEYLDEQINEQLCQAVLSGSKGEGPSKAKIRPVEIKGQVIYQVSETVGTKVLHRNYHREELIQYLKEGLQHHFSQLQSSGMTLDGTVLVSKKGKVTIKIITQKYDKFRQINRFLEFIQDILPKLDQQKEVTILDFGCGKSYLTFAMYYYLRELKGYDVNIIGLDLKTDVIEKCNGLAVKYGYEKLHFYQGDIAD